MWVFRAGSSELQFGGDLSGLGLISFPDVSLQGDGDMFPNPRSDGRKPGLDFFQGQVVSLSVEVRSDHRPLDEVWRELVQVWRADSVRKTRGGLASLTSPDGRTVLGRPRPIEADHSLRLYDVIRVALVFECVDDLWYGVEQFNDLTFVPASGGGLMFPAEAPFVFHSGPQVRNGAVHVDGDVDCWPVFEIHGPVTNPVIEVAGVGSLVFKVGLAYDQVLTVDTRTWVRSVLRDGAPLPGALSASGDRLSDMALKPGAHTILLKGLDPSGTSMLRVKVAPAFTSF